VVVVCGAEVMCSLSLHRSFLLVIWRCLCVTFVDMGHFVFHLVIHI
jgi:hypothetical protein